MKKCFSILFLLVCITSVHAQETESDWKAISGRNEEFSVEVPQSRESIRQNGDDSPIWYSYLSYTFDTYFFIISSKNLESSPYKKIAPYAKDNQAEISKVTIDTFSGEKLTFNDSEGFYQTIVAIKAASHFYIFHAVSKKKNDEIAEKFIGSIRLSKTALPTENKSSTIQKNAENPVRPNTDEKKPQTPNISTETDGKSNDAIGGKGGSSGSGNGSTVPSTNPSEKKALSQTIPIKILSGPRARYTDLARLYDISGRVSIKVVFLANGTIGSVLPASRLPFGLTASAIDAAKQITFVPAMRDGVPVTIAKTVVYEFTFY